MSQDRRTIRTVTTTRTSSYGASSNRSALGYWIPLALTLTAATVGVAAWIWSERDNEEESESEAEQAYAATNRPHNNTGLGDASAAAGAAGLGAAAGYAAMSGGRNDHPNFAPGPPTQGGFQGPPPGAGLPNQPGTAQQYFDGQSRAMSTGVTQEDSGLVARMSSAVGLSRGSPNRQPVNTNSGWASRGLAAAGSMVEGAVNSIKSLADDNQQFSDQEKWSEEADKPERSSPKKSNLQRQGTAAEFYSGAVQIPRRVSVPGQKRKTVAVVVSSVAKGTDGLEVDAHQSILAQLPEFLNAGSTKIIVLIYAPDLHTHPMSLTSRRAVEKQSYAYSTRSQSTSSYARINTPGANGTPSQTPGEFPQDSQNEESDDKGILAHVDPKPVDSRSGSRDNRRDSQDRRDFDRISSNPVDEASPLFKSLYNQANALVDRETSILPFASHEGHKHILRSVQPEIVYIQEPLCGNNGSIVTELQGWVRQTVVVIGDEGGMGGLVDSDTEDESERRKRVQGDWWRKESVTGIGRGVTVVESLHVGDDWKRRVNNEE